MIGKVIEHIERCSIEWNSIEENNENKYLVLRSTDENKEALKKYTELWNGIKMRLRP